MCSNDPAMPSLRRAFAFLAVAAGLSAASRADAQTTPTGTGVTLSSVPVTHTIPRTGYLTNAQINYADCINDDKLEFSMTLGNRGTFALQAWAGTGCDMLANRTNTNTTLCWKLFDAVPMNTSTIGNNVTVEIHVRDLVAGRTIYGASSSSTNSTGGTGGTGGDTSVSGSGGGGTGGTAGSDTSAGTGGTAGTSTSSGSTTLPTGTLVTGTGVEACDDKSGVTSVNPISVYFMLVDGSAAVQGSVATWAGNYKLLAPLPPTDVTADVGDGLLPVHFSNTSGDTTIVSYQLYCDPPPGTAALADAGITPSATDAGAVHPSCQSMQLFAGEHPPDAFKCGSAPLSATVANATGLINGVSYNVGVAATDNYNNVGVISNLTCQVPQPVDGFYKAYRAAGGTAGGGFCSISRKREPIMLFALVGLGACFVLRRRRAA